MRKFLFKGKCCQTFVGDSINLVRDFVEIFTDGTRSAVIMLDPGSFIMEIPNEQEADKKTK